MMENRTAKWRQELQGKLDNAEHLSVSPDLYKAVVDLWWARCERHEGVFEYVFAQLFGSPIKWGDLEGLSPRAKRAIYSFSSPHMYPGAERAYIAEMVAVILIEGNQQELLNAYRRKLLSRLSRLDNQSLQAQRDMQWVQEVLTMLEERDPSVRLPRGESEVVEGEIRSG